MDLVLAPPPFAVGGEESELLLLLPVVYLLVVEVEELVVLLVVDPDLVVDLLLEVDLPVVEEEAEEAVEVEEAEEEELVAPLAVLVAVLHPGREYTLLLPPHLSDLGPKPPRTHLLPWLAPPLLLVRCSAYSRRGKVSDGRC